MPEKTIINIKGSFLSVTPANLSVLDQALTYGKQGFEWDPTERKHIMQITPTTVYTYYENDNALVAPSGLLDRIKKTLRAAGVSFQVKNSTEVRASAKKFEPSNAEVSSLRPEQVKLMSAIIKHPHTVGNAPTGAGKSYLIGMLCQMYPAARIVITTDSLDVIKTLKNYISNTTGEPVGQLGGGKKTEERITCASIRSLHKVLTPPDIVIVDECHIVGGDNACQAVLQLASKAFKVVGLSASSDARADNASLVVEAVCGPTRVKIGYQQSVKNKSVTQLKVHTYECDKGPPYEETEDIRVQADKDRLCVWANHERNELIKDIILNNYLANAPDAQTLIYTERTEHALYLHKLLAPHGFELVHGTVDAIHAEAYRLRGLINSPDELITRKQRDDIHDKFAAGTLRRAICTKVWQKGVNFEELELLFRADATANDITTDQASGRLSRTNDGQKQECTVIDLNDTFNKTYKRRFEARTTRYKEHGWKIKEMSYGRSSKSSTTAKTKGKAKSGRSALALKASAARTKI